MDELMFNKKIKRLGFFLSVLVLSGCGGGQGGVVNGPAPTPAGPSPSLPLIPSACGEQTGTVVAIPFHYVTPMAVGKYITLAATSSLVEYKTHSVNDAPNIDWSRRYKAYKYGDGGAAIDMWRLGRVPPNGTLYEGKLALSAGDVIADPDDLFYVPNPGFSGTDSFDYCAADATGLSNTAVVAIDVADTRQYPMPYGMPDPGFGIDETPPLDPLEWPAAERRGFYYIDSDHALCSDENTYGYPDVPRCSIPTSRASIAAGGKMVLAASALPYTLRDNTWQLIHFEGTAQNPSWLVGNDRGPEKPVIVSHANRANDPMALRITGGYLRISGVVFDGPRLNHRGGEGANEVVVRHSEFKNYQASGGGGTTVGLSTGGNGVLAFNVYAHDNGIVEAEGLTKERDIHAFVGSNQTGYWMLDIRCDENAGDCVQLTNNNRTANVYVGRMVAHSEGENCIDIKDFNRVVVSDSDCWDLRQVKYGNSGGNAQNFYVNDEGVQQNYVYFLNNRSWDTGGTNYGAANIGGRVYFIGNLSFSSPVAKGFFSSAGSGERHVYFNTLMDNEVGIFHYGAGSASDRYVVGNVVVGASVYQTRLQADMKAIKAFDYNFYTDVGDFASGGRNANIYQGLGAFKTATGFEVNSREGIEPGFNDASVYDVSLTQVSALRGAVPADVVANLPFLFDLSNDLSEGFKDRLGTARPSGANYDAGAVAYSSP